jgi:glycolate oxidase
MLSDIVKKELKRISGKENVSFEKEDLLCYSYDATNTRYLPDAVVFPGSAEEISLILKMANSEGFPVVPRGAGTGFTGGSLPVEGGVVLSLERMKSVIEIDAENLTAVVEPGANTWEFQRDVEEMGLFYPPDPTSSKFSTIGGNIAECAGGPRAIKYGVTRDYVLGLEVVLPTGEIINTGVKTVKGVVGYDLTRLLAGSEGTLGVITRATLRLLPLPESVVTMLVVFPDLKSAAEAVSGIIKARITPSALELLEESSLKCVQKGYSELLPERGTVLIIEVDGSPQAAEADASRIKELCTELGAERIETATEKKASKDLWKARKAISASLFALKPNKINEDVVVPRSRIPELLAGVERIAADKGVTIACFGHAGDGNIHVNVMYDKSSPSEAAGADTAVSEVFGLTLKLGGTISGEHGVGTTKSAYIGMELKPVVLELMKSLKKTFDPNGVLNPGKIFPRVEAPHETEAGYGDVEGEALP